MQNIGRPFLMRVVCSCGRKAAGKTRVKRRQKRRGALPEIYIFFAGERRASELRRCGRKCGLPRLGRSAWAGGCSGAAGNGLRRGMEKIRVHAFEPQQADFFVDASGVSGEASVTAHDAMAGNDDGNGIVPHCAAHGLGGHGFPVKGSGGLFGELSVGDHAPPGNAAQRLPDEAAEFASRRGEGQFVGGGLLPGKISVEPRYGLHEHGAVRGGHRRDGQRALKVFLTVDPETDDVILVADDGERTDGGEISHRVEHGTLLERWLHDQIVPQTERNFQQRP